MKSVTMIAILVGIISAASTAKVTLDIYESDGLTLFDGRNIMVGTKLKLIVTSDTNDYWSGGLFIDGSNRDLGILSGSGKDLNTRDYSDCHWENAGPEATVTQWEDSVIRGFGLFAGSNCVPGDWFAIDYTALEPGEPNVGFYEYSVSWDDPNDFVMFNQVPAADFNTDGIVNLLDYSLLSSCWLEDDFTNSSGCQKADLYMNGIIDVNDLILFTDNWLWGSPEPNEPIVPAPVEPDPNLIYRLVDAKGLAEIDISVGETVTLYVEMETYDVNEVWDFSVEVDVSNPNLGAIDNTAYDSGTARILASPNRWIGFDRWGPGYQQKEGISLSGISGGIAFENGHLASFEFTCQGTGDIELTLMNWNTTSTSGKILHPTLEGIWIHQNDPKSQLVMSSGMSISSMEIPEKTLSPILMAKFLEEIWSQDDGVQKLIDEDDWSKFIESVKTAY